MKAPLESPHRERTERPMTTPTIAPVALSFGSTGGVSSVGAPPAKTTGGIAGRDGRAPLDETTMVALADDIGAREEKLGETRGAVRRETLEQLRQLEKDIEEDAWMYAKPRHSEP